MSLRHVILGCLDEPASGYDLKQSLNRSLSHVWAAETSQIYSTLRALEREGLLESSKEKSSKGPERRVYQRTTAGDEAFTAWLDADPELSHERLSVLAQIHFLARERNPAKTRALLEQVRERFLERLAEYEVLKEQEREGVDGVFGHLAMDLGLKTLQARIAWCDEAIERLAGLGDGEIAGA